MLDTAWASHLQTLCEESPPPAARRVFADEVKDLAQAPRLPSHRPHLANIAARTVQAAGHAVITHVSPPSRRSSAPASTRYPAEPAVRLPSPGDGDVHVASLTGQAGVALSTESAVTQFNEPAHLAVTLPQ